MSLIGASNKESGQWKYLWINGHANPRLISRQLALRFYSAALIATIGHFC